MRIKVLQTGLWIAFLGAIFPQTVQAFDVPRGVVVIDGNNWGLRSSCPLFEVPKLQEQLQEKFDTYSYMAYWTLENDVLYLDKVEVRDSVVDVRSIFKSYLKNGRIEASWFTGELKALDVAYSVPPIDSLGIMHHMEDGDTRTTTIMTYALKKGRVVSEKRDEWVHEYADMSSENLLKGLFNPNHLPWEEVPLRSITVHVMPHPDGSFESFKVTYYDDEQDVVLDESSPFVQEVAACVDLVPDWEILRHNGKIVPLLCKIHADKYSGKPTYRVSSLPSGLGDTIVVGKKKYVLNTDPLEEVTDLYARLRGHLRGEFSPMLPKGYIAIWEIKDGQLFLTEIRGGNTGKRLPLSLLEPGFSGDALPATWFTGELWAYWGEPVTDRVDFKGVYDHDAHFCVREGQVLAQGFFENCLVPGDTAVENLCDREIQQSPDWAQFPELKGCLLRGEFAVYPNMDRTVDRIELEELTVMQVALDGRRQEKESIRGRLYHPYAEIFMKSLEKLHTLELRLIHGEIQPLHWWTWVEIEPLKE